MSVYLRQPLTAVLGPTNTGKTHLAVERMLGHQSGMMGFPLRLLAREVYDRVVAQKGERAAALVTGEERIWPSGARYLLCTAEAMPKEKDPRSFIALDEAQQGQDRERGHVFTSRMLHMRGREETMILGSAALKDVIKTLLPEADIMARPRFSTLSYDGPRKLAKLPPRSVIVAFSADEVYALAEALRRISGGAAVVMGSLSPRTRNAQVAMFQAGEVDYLVATDAIGMGLNLDVGHVAFASLNKFDGVRQRRLTVAEMAQIAGRAGRHQRDGSFGSIGAEAAFTDEEVAALEQHRFPAIDTLYWRNPQPSMDNLATLIAGLEEPPSHEKLRAAPEATDLAVLKLLATDADVTGRVSDADHVARLWSACSLPDFTKSGPQAHARLVARLWTDLSSDAGTIDADWFAQRLGALDVTEGSVEVLAERIAKVRTCCYIAQRKDWLADQAGQSDAARTVELRLSDALHAALTARFVDRRTAVLLRALGQGASSLPVAVDDADGSVRVDGEVIGTLSGFAFRVDPAARHADQRMLLAAAERHLATELAQRATALGASDDAPFALDVHPDQAPGISWKGHRVATLVKGRNRLTPRVEPVAAITALDAHLVTAVTARLQRWADDRIAALLGPLFAAEAGTRLRDTRPMHRALLAILVDGLGVVSRRDVADVLREIDQEQRAQVKRLGARFGWLHVYFPALLKPAHQLLRTALAAVWTGRPPVLPPPQGTALIAQDDAADGMPTGTDYLPIGDRRFRIDMVEKVAQHALHTRNVAAGLHERQQMTEAAAPAETDRQGLDEAGASEAGPATTSAPRQSGLAFPIDLAMPLSLSLTRAEITQLLGKLGFVPAEDAQSPAEPLWRYRGPRVSRTRAAGRRPAGRQRIEHGGQRANARQRRARGAAATLTGRTRGQQGNNHARGRETDHRPPMDPAQSPFAVLSGLFDPPPPDPHPPDPEG